MVRSSGIKYSYWHNDQILTDNLFPVWQGFGVNNLFMSCNDKQICKRPSKCNLSYWRVEISHLQSQFMKNSSELLLKAIKGEKRSDFSSENWVRIYSSVPEVSNVKTLTLRENLPASKPWASFSNSRLTRIESICLNHLQASAEAGLGHPLTLLTGTDRKWSRIICSKCKKKHQAFSVTAHSGASWTSLLADLLTVAAWNAAWHQCQR